ncbi:MAG: hypothetical protein U9Q83_07630 [Bacteroidota bacterium]|nr:hypothetical protein [Bacteroidota bacterium]
MKLIKEFLYFSVGFASQTGDKLTKMMQKLIEQNKVTKDEAKTFLDDYSDKIKELTDKFDKKLGDFIAKDVENLEPVFMDDLKAIEKRIAKIEKSFQAPKTHVKKKEKVAPKKKTTVKKPVEKKVAEKKTPTKKKTTKKNTTTKKTDDKK